MCVEPVKIERCPCSDDAGCPYQIEKDYRIRLMKNNGTKDTEMTDDHGKTEFLEVELCDEAKRKMADDKSLSDEEVSGECTSGLQQRIDKTIHKLCKNCENLRAQCGFSDKCYEGSASPGTPRQEDYA